MGNCTPRGIVQKPPSSVRVLTDSGVILNFQGPKEVKDVVKDYPGYGVFVRGHGSVPLPDHECLVNGQFYYLLPLHEEEKSCSSSEKTEQVQQQTKEKEEAEEKEITKESELKDESEGFTKEAEVKEESQEAKTIRPVEADRVSSGAASGSGLDESLARGAAVEALPAEGNGVWKVKLVINTKELEGILSQQVNVEALIERMRMVATANGSGNGAGAGAGVGSSPKRVCKVVGWNLWKPALYNAFKVAIAGGK